MKYKYTVYEKRCPYCGYTIDEDWHEAFLPYIGLLAFPALIAFLLIYRFGLGDPVIPKVGDKIITCPSCSLPIRTDKVTIEDLNAQELLTYRFRVWFYVSGVLGGVFIVSTLCLLLASLPIVSWCGLISLLSLLGVAAIIITYRVKLAKTS